MSKRLQYSREGFFRSIQIRSADVAILVEGQNDRAFYSIVVQSLSPNVRCDILLACEIEGGAGTGKASLLRYYRELRRRKLLYSCLGGKHTTILFILDKDIDDLRRAKARSPHVLYTDTYTLENTLVRDGDLCQSLARAANLDHDSVMRVLDPVQEWTAKAVSHWRPWLEYCLLVSLYNIPNCPNYGVNKSPIHANARSVADEKKLRGLYRQAEQHSGLTASEFEAVKDRVKERVAKLLLNGEYDRVFNGKWYYSFLKEDASLAAAGRQYHRKDMRHTLFSLLAESSDLSASWPTTVRDRIVQLVAGVAGTGNQHILSSSGCQKSVRTKTSPTSDFQA